MVATQNVVPKVTLVCSRRGLFRCGGDAATRRNVLPTLSKRSVYVHTDVDVLTAMSPRCPMDRLIASHTHSV